MHRIAHISLFLTLFFFLNNWSTLYSQNYKHLQDNYSIVAEDAAWRWFSDPRAVYNKRSNEAIYYGFINSNGDVMLKSLDLKTKNTTEYILHKSLEIDDHNVPTFLFLPDGKILTFYNHHNGNIFMRRSKNAENITEWEQEVILLKKDSINRYCYTNPIMLSEENNRIIYLEEILSVTTKEHIPIQEYTAFIATTMLKHGAPRSICFIMMGGIIPNM